MNNNILTKNIIALIIGGASVVTALGLFYSFYPDGSGISAALIALNIFILVYLSTKLVQKEIETSYLKRAIAENTTITKGIKSDVDSLIKRYSIDVSGLGDSDEATKFLVTEMRYMNEILNQLSDSFELSLNDKLKEGPSVNMAESIDEQSASADHIDIDTIKTAKPIDRTEMLRMLRSAIRDQKVDMLLQPIVSLPQRKHRHYECFSQIKDEDGNIISPNNFIQLARDNKLISIIDHTLILRCVQILRKAMAEDYKVSFFCNFTPESLKNEKMLECINDFFKSNPVAAKSIVFEFDYHSLQNDLSDSVDILKQLSKKGWTFSVDQFNDPFALNIKTMKECGVKYLKADADVMIDAINSNHDKLKGFEEDCKKNNIDVIISKIEREEDLKSFLDYNFDYGQGYLFGSPVISNY